MAGLLVLGASGLLGRAVVDEARQEGDAPVTGVGRTSPGVERADRGHQLDLTFATVSNVVDLLVSVSPSAVINCIGQTEGDRPSLGRANIVTVGVLLEALAQWGRMPRLVHLGSAAEYAASPRGTNTREDDPLEPKTAYGITKLAATRLVELAIGAGEIDGVVARVFNPLGPGMPESSMPGRAAHVIGRAAANGL
ncbi:MAG: NAD-dependent epimerase/dehydratase family protein, partial [Chloroflexota bacterium]